MSEDYSEDKIKVCIENGHHSPRQSRIKLPSGRRRIVYFCDVCEIILSIDGVKRNEVDIKKDLISD